MADVEVIKDDKAWMARVDGHAAGQLAYRDSLDGSSVVLVHTEVGDEFEGRGVGSALVRAAVDDIAAQGRVVRPDCPFAADWLRRHPDHPVQVQQRT